MSKQDPETSTQSEKDDGPPPGEDEEKKPIIVDSSESFCRTPTSEDHKIPRCRSCPPAPRKPTQRHKRKLSDTQFFETKGREEIESFFESGVSQEPSEGRRNKRRSTTTSTTTSK